MPAPVSPSDWAAAVSDAGIDHADEGLQFVPGGLHGQPLTWSETATTPTPPPGGVMAGVSRRGHQPETKGD
jgi:hypothetical protein